MSKQVFRQLLKTPKANIKAVFDFKQIIVYSTSFSKVKVTKIVNKFISFKEQLEEKDLKEYELEQNTIEYNFKSKSIIKTHTSILGTYVHKQQQDLQKLVNQGGWIKWYADYKQLITGKQIQTCNAVIVATNFEQQLHDSFPAIYK